MAKSSFKERFQKALVLLNKILLIFFISSAVSVLAFRFINPPCTPLMLIRVVEQLWDGKSVKMKKDWKHLDEISRYLPVAVIASEDQLFLEHWGFDFKAMEKAFENNGKKKKRIKGGSTITQQVAKNVFLWHGRSYVRKAFEAYFTVLIELLWTKERIMEVYLNVAELGDGIYGAEACAQTRFDKKAKKLSRAECALIAAILPNPRKWNPAKPTGYIQKRKSWILKNMSNLGKIKMKQDPAAK